jgi:dolichol kinase
MTPEPDPLASVTTATQNASEAPTPSAPAPSHAPSATRKDLQLGRRLVHCANGCAIATAYALIFTHQQIVHTFGSTACLVYILDRVRIFYPELLERAPWINRLLFRAEEQFKESAMTPYAIAILLTLLTFPKTIALIAIYTLRSPIRCRRWSASRGAGAHRAEKRRGSLAFFVATAVITAVVFRRRPSSPAFPLVAAILLVIGVAGAAFECCAPASATT